MSDCFVGEIRLFAFTANHIPSGWLPCDGRSLTIADYEPLYALLGITYGGDGATTFNLPDLRGRLAIGAGQGAGLPNYVQGASGGNETVTLTASQIPAHTHALLATTAAATDTAPGASVVFAANTATPPVNHYAVLPATPRWFAFADQSVATAGGGGAHANVMPSFGLNYCIAFRGEFPSRQ